MIILSTTLTLTLYYTAQVQRRGVTLSWQPDWTLRQEEANMSKKSYYLVDPGLKLWSISCEEQIWSEEDREKGASQYVIHLQLLGNETQSNTDSITWILCCL